MSPGTLCLHSHVACVRVGECFARLGASQQAGTTLPCNRKLRGLSPLFSACRSEAFKVSFSPARVETAGTYPSFCKKPSQRRLRSTLHSRPPLRRRNIKLGKELFYCQALHSVVPPSPSSLLARHLALT
eukprot:s2389_g8.t1